MTTLQEAIDYLQGAQFANYSGQIVEQVDGKDKTIICDLGCTCGEIASKNADEYGEMLVTLLNGASSAAELLRDIEQWIVNGADKQDGDPFLVSIRYVLTKS